MSLLFQKLLLYTYTHAHTHTHTYNYILFKYPERRSREKNGGIYDGMQRFAFNIYRRLNKNQQQQQQNKNLLKRKNGFNDFLFVC